MTAFFTYSERQEENRRQDRLDEIAAAKEAITRLERFGCNIPEILKAGFTPGALVDLADGLEHILAERKGKELSK